MLFSIFGGDRDNHPLQTNNKDIASAVHNSKQFGYFWEEIFLYFNKLPFISHKG